MDAWIKDVKEKIKHRWPYPIPRYTGVDLSYYPPTYILDFGKLTKTDTSEFASCNLGYGKEETVVNQVFTGWNNSDLKKLDWSRKEVALNKPNELPMLSCTFSDEFGNAHTVTGTLMNSTIHEVFAAMRLACLGFGFSEENVKEYFGEPD